MNHNKQKKIACINDFTGFGRCSLAVQLPIISKCKIQCCPLPTSIFSNHTGFDSFYFYDFTNKMENYMNEWKKLNLEFEGICTGFLGSLEQIEMVSKFIDQNKNEKTIVIIDPVMGDYGKMYSTYTKQMCQNMFRLVQKADIVTPNITEACILTNTSYKEKWTQKELLNISKKICDLGPSKVVITGIHQKTFVCNFCFQKDGSTKLIKTHKVGSSRSGTGDIFASIIACDAVNGIDFEDSVKKASRFIKKCIEKAIEMEIPLTDGVPFEELLNLL